MDATGDPNRRRLPKQTNFIEKRKITAPSRCSADLGSRSAWRRSSAHTLCELTAQKFHFSVSVARSLKRKVHGAARRVFKNCGARFGLNRLLAVSLTEKGLSRMLPGTCLCSEACSVGMDGSDSLTCHATRKPGCPTGVQLT